MEAHPGVSYPGVPIARVLYRLDKAADGVRALQERVDSLAHFINSNSAHGYFEERGRLKKDLEALRYRLRMWQTRYNTSALALVE